MAAWQGDWSGWDRGAEDCGSIAAKAGQANPFPAKARAKITIKPARKNRTGHHLEQSWLKWQPL